MEKITQRLIDKSVESFLLGLEIYHKPTIMYRVEGFSFFVCNAWELMLKAHLIKSQGASAIYYKKDPSRTISLEDCIKKVFTNKNDPLRLNLEKIIELRNTSTHFVVEEFETIYAPLFQSCVMNFSEKLFKFHDVNTHKYISQSFLTLRLSPKELSEQDVVAKYPDDIAQKLISTKSKLSGMSQGVNDSSFSVVIDHQFYITKNRDAASAIVKIDNSSNTPVKIVKEVKNPNETHKFNMKKCVEQIRSRIKKESIPFEGDFNRQHFMVFTKYYNLKSDEKFCFTYSVNSTPIYSYSYRVIDFIIDKLKENPDVINHLKSKKS